MAKLINEGTPDECLSGRIGNIIIVQRKNGPFIRMRPKKHQVSKSEQSQRARHRFAMAVSFMKNAAHIVRLGVWPKPTNAISQATSELLKHALAEDKGEYFIDYTRVLLSKGTVEVPDGIRIHSLPSGEVVLNYQPPRGKGMVKELIVALYNPIAGFWDLIKGPWPGNGRFCFKPAAFDVLEAYAFLRHTDGSDASLSVYLGPIACCGI